MTSESLLLSLSKDSGPHRVPRGVRKTNFNFLCVQTTFLRSSGGSLIKTCVWSGMFFLKAISCAALLCVVPEVSATGTLPELLHLIDELSVRRKCDFSSCKLQDLCVSVEYRLQPLEAAEILAGRGRSHDTADCESHTVNDLRTEVGKYRTRLFSDQSYPHEHIQFFRSIDVLPGDAYASFSRWPCER